MVALLVPHPATAQTASTAASRPDTLRHAFTQAAARYGVPERVLLGVSYLESRWDGHRGAPSVSGGYGPMHLTDARTALSARHRHGDGGGDGRGDPARPRVAATSDRASALPDRLRTLDRAATLTGLSAATLRADPAANVLGGAALLAAAQRELRLPARSDPAAWYGAVAKYSGAADARTAATFADDVFDVLRGGERRTTDSGDRLVLPATPGLRPQRGQMRRLGLTETPSAGTTCPHEVTCESVPAPYERLGDDDYGNHDKADRPRSQRVDYIVVHDTEGYWDTDLRLVQDPSYVSWHYTVRSSDGLVAQHVPTKDVAWHAGNWYVNAKSIGVEHAGFLTEPDTWYTEEMYRASARLVRFLADTYDVPLDRQHILGHDNVPGTVASSIPDMHTDPGPYWDWAHYFELLGAPFHRTAGPSGGLVTILPDYGRHRPSYTGCAKAGERCAGHGSAAVRLHTAPDSDAPLVKDVGLRPGGGDSTTDVNDTGARASTGQTFAVAGHRGGWTAIWYLGRRAWFHNPPARPTAVGARGWVVTPKPGHRTVPVYGRAYPEREAYPPGVPVQDVAPLPYTLRAAQTYPVGLRTRGEYLWADTFDPAGHRVVRGEEAYYQIQFGHRVAFVKAGDVVVRPSTA